MRTTSPPSRPPAAWLLLVALALARLALHCATNWQYGFHRDELGVLDDARFLDWGYVSYPPFTPFVGRIALLLFGPSLVGLRFFSALAQSVAMVLTGLMARELGGRRWAQAVAALAAAVAPMAVCMGTMFQYIAFDYLWWVLAAYCLLRLFRDDDPRWWIALGAIFGLGMMTKYTMIFFIAGVAAGILLTPARLYLRSPWLWAGAALSVVLFLPNIMWQIKHDFISLTFLNHIHERDVEIGRTDGFLIQQLFVSANIFTLPLWATGLWFYFVRPAVSPYKRKRPALSRIRLDVPRSAYPVSARTRTLLLHGAGLPDALRRGRSDMGEMARAPQQQYRTDGEGPDVDRARPRRGFQRGPDDAGRANQFGRLAPNEQDPR
ncbi:MAG: glycosyltransferase family 39 protein [Spartobacteria bacterium]